MRKEQREAATAKARATPTSGAMSKAGPQLTLEENFLTVSVLPRDKGRR